MLKKSTLHIIQFFSFVLVVFSTYSLVIEETGFYYRIGRFFHSGFIHAKFFTPFEILFLLLLFNILNYYKFKLRFTNGILLFAFIAYATRMINPNSETSNPILGMPLLSNLSEYLFLFTILVLVSMPATLCKIVLERIFRYVLMFSVIKAIIIVVMYFTGIISFVRFNYVLMLPEIDT